MAKFFSDQRYQPSSQDRGQSVLADLVDSACRSAHQCSERHMPVTQSVTKGWPSPGREQSLTWLTQALEVMKFPDSLLHDSALLLDRYYGCLAEEPGSQETLHRKLLAAVCIGLKLDTGGDMKLVRKCVDHLSQQKIPFKNILAEELCILNQLEFEVGTPTVWSFLETLSTRLHDFHAPESSQSLAKFLIQLSLFHASCHYGYPHVVLAASALLLALKTTRATGATSNAVLEDLAVHCPDALVNGSLMQCVFALHHLWIRSLSGQDSQPCLMMKFCRASYHKVSSLEPPMLLPFPWLAHGLLAHGLPNMTPTMDSFAQAASIAQESLGAFPLAEDESAVQQSPMGGSGACTTVNTSEELIFCARCAQCIRTSTRSVPGPCPFSRSVPLRFCSTRSVPLCSTCCASRVNTLLQACLVSRCARH